MMGLLLALVALTLGGFWFGLWSAGSLAPRWRVAVGLVAVVPALLTAVAHLVHGWPHLALACPWLLPALTWRSWAVSDWTLAAVGLSAGFVQAWADGREDLRRSLGRMIVPLLAVALVASPQLKPLLQPVAWAALGDTWSDGVCLQSTPHTCGPASLATVLRPLGVPLTEADIARQAGCSKRGTEVWHLARVAAAAGRTVAIGVFDPARDDWPVGAVAQVRLGTFDHFVAVIGHHGDRYRVGDPATGLLELTPAAARQRYGVSGLYLAIGP